MKQINTKTEKNKNQNDSIKLLREVNKKLDYVIKLIREEELRYPYHNNYIETQLKKRH